MSSRVKNVIAMGLTNQDKKFLNNWRVAFRCLSEVLLEFEEISEKTIRKVDFDETEEIDVKKALDLLNKKLDDFFDEDQFEDAESGDED